MQAQERAFAKRAQGDAGKDDEVAVEPSPELCEVYRQLEQVEIPSSLTNDSLRRRFFAAVDELRSRYTLLRQRLSTGDPDMHRDHGKEARELEEVVSVWKQLCEAASELGEFRTSLTQEGDTMDESTTEWLNSEVEACVDRISELEADLLRLLVPVEVNDSRNVILEVKASAGGAEAQLFASELLDMYQNYARAQGWRVEQISLGETEVGGLREASISIKGEMVFQRLKFESGVHRVQRIPATESSGRMHTSTVSVAILPEPEKMDLTIKDSDIRIETFRSSGAGGQSVNTTDSAVRVVHIPTGVTVSIQDERSQHSNKAKALQVLHTRLYAAEQQRLNAERASSKQQLIGSGERSERIRTYNFPQARITDHRVGITLTDGGLERMLAGLLLDDFVEPLLDLEVQMELECRLDDILKQARSTE